MFEQLELTNTDVLNYTEFISATMDKKIFFTREKIWSAFKYFDVD